MIWVSASCQDSTVWTEVAARGRVRSADDGTRSHGPRRIPSSSSMTASIVHTGAVHIPPISSSEALTMDVLNTPHCICSLQMCYIMTVYFNTVLELVIVTLHMYVSHNYKPLTL